MTTQPASEMRAVDSLSAHEFRLEINGQPVDGIFSVQGLTALSLEQERPPLVISKMVQQDPSKPFNRWIQESQTGGKPIRDIAVVALDEGRETRRWVYRSAYIVSISYSDFDTASGELVEERVAVRAQGVEVVWP